MIRTIGIVGLGPMGKRYVEAVKSIENVRLAVVDLREEAVRSVKESYKGVEITGYSSHMEMLNNEEIEVLIIATNGPSHYDLFLDGVKSGIKKIICEKPIATSLHHAQKMVQLSKELGVMFAVNHARRQIKDYILLQKKLKEGVIGKVESIFFSMGGGQMACNGTHFIDLASFLLEDKVVKVSGYLNDKGVPNPRGPQFKDPGGYAIFHFERGSRMFFELTEDLGIPPILFINGKYGRVTINELQGSYVIERRAEEDLQLPVTRYGTPLRHVEKRKIEIDIILECRNLVNSMLEGRVIIDPQYAVDALEAIIGIHYSHEHGNENISLPLKNQDICSRLFMFT